MSAALTTQGAKNLRPAAVLAAVLLAAALLAGLVGLAGSRIVTSQQPAPGAAHPLVTRGTTVSTGIPYVGTGSAAETIRNGYVGTQVQVVPSALPGTTVPSGIPYVGTGPAAETIRLASRGTTVSTGIPYVGTGSAAETIRNGYVGTQVQVVPSAVPGTTVPSGIPYVGTGPAADTIRASGGASKPPYTWSWNAGR